MMKKEKLIDVICSAHMWCFHVWLTVIERPLIPDVVALIMLHTHSVFIFV